MADGGQPRGVQRLVIRDAILEGQGLETMWDEIWPLLVIGVVAAPVGLWIFRCGEIHAKKHGKLKRSG